MTTGLVFDAYQGHLGEVHGVALGVAVLALDDTTTDLIGSMATLDEVTAWEIQTADAPDYARSTAEVVYALEPDTTGNAGVVRYGSTPPTFDLAGADEATGQPNALVFYVDEGADADCPIVFATYVEQGDGFNGWSPDQHELGLARVRRVTSTVPPGGTTGQSLVKASNVDGDTTWGDAAGSTGSTRPAPLRLGAAWCIDAEAAAGVITIADQGRAGIDGISAQHAMAPMEADAWTGKRLIGRIDTEAGAAWPVDGVKVTIYDGMAHRHQRVPAGMWSEWVVCTSDEVNDYLEPGSVFLEDGLHAGIDIRVNDVDEYTWLSDDPVFEFDTSYDKITYTVDPATAIVTVAIDDVTVASGPLGRAEDPDDLPDLPLELTIPPTDTTLSIVRTGLSASRIEVAEFTGDPLIVADVADAADGARTFTSGDHDWVGVGGIVTTAPTYRSFMNPGGTGGRFEFPDDAVFDLGTGDDVTLVVRHRIWSAPASGGHWFSRDAANAVATGGWGLVSVPGFGITYGVLASDGVGGPVIAASGTLPTVEHVAVIQFDRTNDELRFYTCPIGGVPTLHDTEDISSLGAVSPSEPLWWQGPGGHVARWAAVFRRTLDIDEITYLAQP